MNLLRRLFGGGSAATIDRAIHLYVRCNRCGAPVHVRVDPGNDLVIEYDRGRHEINRQIEGGAFISKEEYDQLVAQSEQERTTMKNEE